MRFSLTASARISCADSVATAPIASVEVEVEVEVHRKLCPLSPGLRRSPCNQ
jgi:hypothetical protein